MLKDNLRRLRQEAGLTQVDLAKRAGVATTTIYEAEAGRTRMLKASTSRKLSSALGVTPRDLVKEERPVYIKLDDLPPHIMAMLVNEHQVNK